MTDPAPHPAVAELPVFGRFSGTLDDRQFRPFGLNVEGRRRPDGPEERWVERFEAFTEVDGGQWVAIGNARTELAQAQAVVRFLGTNLRDDDGAPLNWSPPVVPARDPDKPDDAEEPWLTDDETGQPLYEWWDGSLYLREELPDFDELEEGSSRRRFGYISDAMDLRYRIEALREIAGWLTENMTGFPTRQPAPSGRGPSPTARGRGGKRRG